MKPTCVAIQGMPDGESGGIRLARFMTDAPPCQSSMPASAPCRCTASVIRAWALMSRRSQRLAKGKGASSEVGWMEHAPVQMTPQPPSAFASRKAARTRGKALVIPLA